MRCIKIICILGLLAVMASPAFSTESKRMAKITSIEGKAEVKLMGEKAWTPAREGMALGEGDALRTAKKSWALLYLNGGAETADIEVEENSTLLISELKEDKDKKIETTLLDLAIGEVLIKAKKVHSPDSKFEVKTPTSIVGVRGTKFSVKVEALE